MKPRIVAAVLLAFVLPGCALFQTADPLAEDVNLVAVLPVEKDAGRVEQNGHIVIEADAANVLTASIYAALAQAPVWRFVPDVQVNDALRKVDRQTSQSDRAVQLGKLTSADAVLYGTVTRYMERVGSEYGATQGASVAFNLHLISAHTGAILWEDEFDETQKPLSENLFKWWMFWSAGPKWMSAAELASLGVERLQADLKKHLQ